MDKDLIDIFFLLFLILDPEEFLNLLLNQITKADPFLHIR